MEGFMERWINGRGEGGFAFRRFPGGRRAAGWLVAGVLGWLSAQAAEGPRTLLAADGDEAAVASAVAGPGGHLPEAPSLTTFTDATHLATRHGDSAAGEIYPWPSGGALTSAGPINPAPRAAGELGGASRRRAIGGTEVAGGVGVLALLLTALGLSLYGAPMTPRLLWWRLLSRLGHVPASVRLASRLSRTGSHRMTGHRNSRTPRNRQARRYLKRAAEGGDHPSALALGKGYSDGTFGRLDVFQAAKYLRLASAGGLAEADFQLGLLLEAAHDWEAARASFEQAARRGYVQGLAAAAELTERHPPRGAGPASVVAAYRTAARAGVPSAALRLATLLVDSEGAPEDYAEALALLQSPAVRTEPRARFLAQWLQASGHDPATTGAALVRVRRELALACWQGRDTDPDWRSAWRWATAAAEGGDPEAVWLVGRLLLGGVGVIRDPQAACKHLEAAAFQGHSGAQFELARQLAAAGGSGPELEQAYAWAEVAALEGRAERVAWRDELATRLDRDAQERAVTRARELMARLRQPEAGRPSVPGGKPAPRHPLVLPVATPRAFHAARAGQPVPTGGAAAG
jgi:TPR repeat protein